jgi:cation diffusion facilitator CzcD-associated flavoprotein CzcO
MSRQATERALANMREQVRDPALHAVLTPSFPIGGKRVLISDDYYPTLNRDNVHVVTSGIDHVTPEAIVTRDGVGRRVDAIILGTGFESTAFLAPMRIEGLGGRVLSETWRQGAEAYLGLTVSGFPNLFMMYGPNTNLGHNSIIFMIECQTRYIMDCLAQMNRRDLRYIDLKTDVMAVYNARLRRRLAGSAWASTDRSWYKTREGRITNNWAGTTIEYWWRTRRADLGAYHQCAGAQQVGSQAGQVRSAA